MKILSIALICFFLLSCSSTKVHLYTRYLSEQQTGKITKILEEHDFEVIANTLSFPDDVQQSTLLYSPFVKGEDNLNILIDSLENLGWRLPIVKPLFAGNHYYTKNSVGLLLLPDGLKQSDKLLSQDLVNDYEAEKCEISVKLRLNRDETYQLSYSDVPFSQPEHLTGKWHIPSYPYIKLVSANKMWSFYFEIQKKTDIDLVSKVEIIELKPVDKHHVFPYCSFTYGVRI
ncbi:hypothetical protein [Colwellia sp. Bg11-28]|uniref:hypothetical protein n=1 Tax=Colwellia sp. Bg11-28 TaxID=2058305 RepID=UPI000C34C4F6|nr:hypothetical protein [Colwellia sp. Bg11-28]PKH88094.1 hypothetical protein CXF79_15950 [Colwellia sp. Bg11-28]